LEPQITNLLATFAHSKYFISKSKLAESKKGNKNPMFGKFPHNTGKRWSKEVKRKISETLKNKKIIKSYNQ